MSKVLDMKQSYLTIEETGLSELIEKKSRFIGEIRHVESEEEAAAFFEETRKKYWDSSHVCTAYVIGIDRQITKCSDDKEPSGTAGKPMLEVLTANGLTNVAATVTRYFGGTLLGTGGLVRAYSGSVSKALSNTRIVSYAMGEVYKLTCDYSSFERIKKALISEDIGIENIEYGALISADIKLPMEKRDMIKTKIDDLTNAKAKLEFKEVRWL